MKKIVFIITLSISLLRVILSPAYSSCSSWEDIESYRSVIEQHGTLLTTQSFKPDPRHTAAGALLYALKDDQFHILMGLRIDSKSYSNLGGKSEVTHKSLAETAATEITEESIGVYSPHPGMLEKKPYVDILTSSLLYRLYFQEVPFVSSKYLEGRLSKSMFK